jgi:2'-5' RNA ligase
MENNAGTLGWRTLDSWGDGVEPVNSFALVAYIPMPLGRFLDELRRELVPTFIPRAHVTILPPRPLTVDPRSAWEHVYSAIKDFPPFEIALADVEVFESTSVVYIAVGPGRRVLLQMHDQLNAGPVRYEEPYLYQPHITLAQELNPRQLASKFDLARRRWTAYLGERWFAVDRVTFVQNTTRGLWLDLAEGRLGVPTAR